MAWAVRPRRSGDPDRRAFEGLPFHGWYGCKGCGSVVYDWAAHAAVCHEHTDEEPEEAAAELPDLTARARAEANAEVEFSAFQQIGHLFQWRRTWRELRRAVAKRPVPVALPAPAAELRRQDWARMAPIIAAVTRQGSGPQ